MSAESTLRSEPEGIKPLPSRAIADHEPQPAVSCVTRTNAELRFLGIRGKMKAAIRDLLLLDPKGPIPYHKIGAIAKFHHVKYWDLYHAFQKVRGLHQERKGDHRFCWLCIKYVRSNPREGVCQLRDLPAKAEDNSDNKCIDFLRNPRITRRRQTTAVEEAQGGSF